MQGKSSKTAQPDKTTQKRAEILAAAMDAFAENGYHATKISDIAQRLGMGHGTFYRYFENKLDIFISVIDLIIGKVASIVESDYPTATNSAGEYHQQIIRLGERIFEVFREDMRFGPILFYEALGVDPALNARMEALLDAIAQATELYFINGVKKGFLRQDLDTLILSKAITGVLVAGVRDVMSASDPEAVTKRWSRTIAGLMISGMS
ncbi:transcriptional regulator, TetR family [Desulfatibacillum alkenivorans DSM 16219]|uniref:Transcriptional regulator, TetR family n=1 Tax=Desulfatibacillum alkenivorans DSM 16219 TaxID=1121393 RepID=A0A1M6J5S3_9BACT|nr:TetR/AcrR family transcriptional regulator [Desulfatibacillum alkenivorans]SHJ42033.1 transcriptional regulator, TetR family [Desulfatibacillum alkenivorans DSM 16219]